MNHFLEMNFLALYERNSKKIKNIEIPLNLDFIEIDAKKLYIDLYGKSIFTPKKIFKNTLLLLIVEMVLQIQFYVRY